MAQDIPIDSDPVTFTRQIVRQASDALDRAGVAIYPVRQMLGTSGLDLLDDIADLTGGRRGTDRGIDTAIKQAMNDLRFSYQLGYYPPSSNWNGKFHKLRVTSTRKGVRIQAKTGYYAWPQLPGSRALQAMSAIEADEFDAAEIGLRASVQTGGAESPDPAHIDLRIDARDLALARQGALYKGQLWIGTVGYSSEGKSEPADVTPFSIRYNAAQRQRALQEGVPVTVNVTVNLADPGKESKFRVIVFDHGSGAAGSVTIPASAFSGNTR